jgi:hypothetical protein
MTDRMSMTFEAATVRILQEGRNTRQKVRKGSR